MRLQNLKEGKEIGKEKWLRWREANSGGVAIGI